MRTAAAHSMATAASAGLGLPGSGGAVSAGGFRPLRPRRSPGRLPRRSRGVGTMSPPGAGIPLWEPHPAPSAAARRNPEDPEAFRPDDIGRRQGRSQVGEGADDLASSGSLQSLAVAGSSRRGRQRGRSQTVAEAERCALGGLTRSRSSGREAHLRKHRIPMAARVCPPKLRDCPIRTMAERRQRTRYRFPRLERRGVIAGSHGGQIAAVALESAGDRGSYTIRSQPSASGVVFAVVCAAVGIAVAFWPIQGRTGERWASSASSCGGSGRVRTAAGVRAPGHHDSATAPSTHCRQIRHRRCGLGCPTGYVRPADGGSSTAWRSSRFLPRRELAATTSVS